MLIAQITDIHLGFDPGNPGELNRQRLDMVLDRLTAGPNRPDLLLVTGDLTDRGDRESYARLAEALAPCRFPVHLCVGNHDLRDPFRAQFPNVPDAFGFIQYAIDLDGLRILVLDTLEEGRHGGAFCAIRAAWLRARLAEKPDVPTIIAMHHPPVELGIDWMDTASQEPWVARFTQAMCAADQVKAIVCGHVHRPVMTLWQGRQVTVCASSSPEVALDFRPINPDATDDRAMIVAEAPGLAFHRWDGERLVTHFDVAGNRQTLAHYDANMQALVRHLLEERPAEAGNPAAALHWQYTTQSRTA
ncbi:phosphodiesterase [Sphingobium sp. SJ10-10]|uniref:phosphodiesterase n=1 Tax=Sphingobium sp. SJ10-10 TaxID=3114999 RepID=UPI002E18BB9A|nr:phosphodiesterase [Sphingobium sp. SJ10-10]